jgi:hypothetical protein
MSVPMSVGSPGSAMNRRLPHVTVPTAQWNQRESPGYGHLLAAAVILVSFAVSLAGPGARIVYYGFPVASSLITIELLRRHYWYAYLTFAAWLWFLSPFLRRVVDWQTTYHASSAIQLAPALAGLLAIPVALLHRRQVDRTIGRLFAFATVVFVYGAVVGLLRNGPSRVLIDVLAVIAPFGAGLFALTVPPDPAKLRRTLVSICVWGSIVMGAYGVLQFLVVPAWDARWVADSGITTVGQAKAGAIRVFSTLNTSNPFGEVIAVTLLVALAERRYVLRGAAVLFGFLALGLSLVRAAWIAIAVAFAGLINNNRIRVVTAVIVMAVGLVGLLTFGGSITSAVSTRVDNSVAAGSNDESLNARLNFQRSILGPTLVDVAGEGMGSTGAALRTSGDAFVGGTDKRRANFDSGIFENATVYGSVLGLGLFVGLIAGNVAAWRRSRGGPLEIAFCASAVTLLVVSLFFQNTIQGATGYLLWVLLAVCGRAVGEKGKPRSADEAGVVVSEAVSSGPLAKRPRPLSPSAARTHVPAAQADRSGVRAPT